MQFTSISYILFVILVLALFYVTKDRYKWSVLLGASIYFYSLLNQIYLLIELLIVICVTYCIGILLEKSQNQVRRKMIFCFGVLCNIGTLIMLKYFTLILSSINATLNTISLSFRLPQYHALVLIGASYYVFQAVSYLIDVYLEIETPEKHFGIFALYISFFPKLLQGPIERAGDLLPQLRSTYTFDVDNLRKGILLFIWGLFKKVVVADRLALFVNAVYGDVHAYNGLPMILATYAFAFQLYFDFSGYTDMAIGTARIFNIKLTHNFNSPYLATSMADFWRRWHITFSRWILDYIFKPLQIRWRDWKTHGTACALLVTFLVSGIWHGASWCFVMWGLLHGVFLTASVYYKPVQKNIHHRMTGLVKSKMLKLWQIAVTFNLVCFAWIFFRAESLADAFYIVTHLFSGYGGTGSFLMARGNNELALTTAALSLMLLIHSIRRNTVIMSYLNYRKSWPSTVLCIMLLVSIILVNEENSTAFIYFKF